MSKEKIYIFRYHGRDARELSNLINDILKKYSGEFLGVEDQNEISFNIPYLFSWATPKKFVILKLKRLPNIFCKNCNLSIDIENIKIRQMCNFRRIYCRSCGLPLKDLGGGDIKLNRLVGNSQKIAKLIEEI